MNFYLLSQWFTSACFSLPGVHPMFLLQNSHRRLADENPFLSDISPSESP